MRRVHCVEEMTAQLLGGQRRPEVRLPGKSATSRRSSSDAGRAAPGIRIVVLLDEIGALLPEACCG